MSKPENHAEHFKIHLKLCRRRFFSNFASFAKKQIRLDKSASSNSHEISSLIFPKVKKDIAKFDVCYIRVLAL